MLNRESPPFYIRNQAVPLIRDFFKEQNLEEACTSLLQPTTALEPYVEALYLGEMVLPTSPEFALKKMLALQGGKGGLYEIAKVARGDRKSALHSQSFTMVEWYRINREFMSLAEDVAEMMFRLSGQRLSLAKFSVADLFQQQLGFDIAPEGNLASWRNFLGKEIVVNSEAEEQAALIEAFSVTFDQNIQPFLAQQKGLVLVYDYPKYLRGMAELNEDGWAKKVEVFYRGVELANGYQELADAPELKELWLLNNKMRALRNRPAHEIDETLLHLTPKMKGVAGMAMGLERALMTLFSIKQIAEFDLP